LGDDLPETFSGFVRTIGDFKNAGDGLEQL